MSRTVTFSARQVRAKPRPLVGTKTWIRKKERDMRDQEWSDDFAPVFDVLRENYRREAARKGAP